MKTIYGLENLKQQKRPSVVTVGVFDGVHTGHQKIIRELIACARALKAVPCVVTFDPHPVKVVEDEKAVSTLSSLGHRLRLLEDLGAGLCLVIRFDKSIAAMSAKSFIADILAGRLNMKALIVGASFSFGRERLDSPSALRNIAKSLGFKLFTVEPKKHHNRTISSSLIRHLIENGSIAAASKLLGRPVSILGTVIHGKKRGRIMGFKTANIDPHHEAIPPSGSYAVYSRFGGKTYKSVLNIGRRPTFNEYEPSIEVHIFDFNKNIYGKDIEVLFVKRLRPERKFKNEDHLRRQILKDAIAAQKIL